jgi:hypothetical protein
MTWLRRLWAWWTRPPWMTREQSIMRAMAREAARNRGDLALCQRTRAAMLTISGREYQVLAAKITVPSGREG